MLRQLRVQQRDDYRVEKDRCAQFLFLQANQIPFPPLLGQWSDREALKSDLRTGAAIANATAWPIFLKACHLTQHSSTGTISISSREALHDGMDAIVDFVDDKWDFRANDRDREWEAEGDQITDVLQPGFVLQSPMTQPSDPQLRWGVPDGERVSVGLVEVRVEVLWGLAYLVHLDATAFYRRDGVTEDYSGFLGGVLHQPPRLGPDRAWIATEGYLQCAFSVAEQLAHAAHIEYIRVDVFLDRGQPGGCMVNEISLTSGYPYFGHGDYMARLWAEPLKSKQYQLFGSDEAVYSLTTQSGSK